MLSNPRFGYLQSGYPRSWNIPSLNLGLDTLASSLGVLLSDPRLLNSDFPRLYQLTVAWTPFQLLSPWSATSKASSRSKMTLLSLFLHFWCSCLMDVRTNADLVIDLSWQIPWVPILGRTKIPFFRKRSTNFESNTFWLATKETPFSQQKSRSLFAISCINILSSLPDSNFRFVGLSLNSVLQIKKYNLTPKINVNPN